MPHGYPPTIQREDIGMSDVGGPGRIVRQHDPEDRSSDDPGVIPAAAAPSRALLDGVDELLDEIDGVLEENAEEFVRGYVQKGGQ